VRVFVIQSSISYVEARAHRVQVRVSSNEVLGGHAIGNTIHTGHFSARTSLQTATDPTCANVLTAKYSFD